MALACGLSGRHCSVIHLQFVTMPHCKMGTPPSVPHDCCFTTMLPLGMHTYSVTPGRTWLLKCTQTPHSQSADHCGRGVPAKDSQQVAERLCAGAGHPDGRLLPAAGPLLQRLPAPSGANAILLHPTQIPSFCKPAASYVRAVASILCPCCHLASPARCSATRVLACGWSLSQKPLHCRSFRCPLQSNLFGRILRSRLVQETLKWLSNPASQLDPNVPPPGLENWDPIPYLAASLPISVSVFLTQTAHEIGHRVMAALRKVCLGVFMDP